VPVPFVRSWIDNVRRNHALEHATVSVLLARHGPQRLAGRAAGNGFFFLGDVPSEELTDSAREALSRLQRGEAGLAVSPLCGTNIAMAGLLAAGAATMSLSRGRGRFGNAFSAAMVGVVLSQPLGRFVQKYVTTRADLENVEVVGTRNVLGGLRKVQTRTSL
jgi:hypothetical protein